MTNDEEAATSLSCEDHQEKNDHGTRRNDKNNEMLRMVVVGLGVVSSMLVGCIISIVASRSFHAATTPTAIDVLGNAAMTDIDVHTGIAYAAGLEHPVLKTEDVIFYSDNMDIAAMTNDELKVLKEILLDDDNLKFVVKGFGRDAINYNEEVVHVIVEGGTLTWDSTGIVDASGDVVNMVLDSAFPPQDQGEEVPQANNIVEREEEEFGIGGGHRDRHQRGRRLPSSCTYGGRTGSGSSNRSRSF